MTATPNELKYFIELAHTLNFSRASERIGISQPSLSLAIKRLEEAIGAELLIRGKNGAHLTQAGKRLYKHAAQLLQLWDTVKSECLASHQEVKGMVSLGCHPSVGLISLPGCIPELIVKYPHLELKFRHDLSRHILEEIINYSVDIGIIVNPVRHPDIVIHKLCEDRVTLWRTKTVNHPGLDIRSGKAIILCDPELVQTQSILKKMHKCGYHYGRLITGNNLEVIAQLTAAGTGIGILPGLVATPFSLNNLEPVPKMPFFKDEIYLVFRHENRNIMAVRAVIEFIKGYYKTNTRL